MIFEVAHFGPSWPSILQIMVREEAFLSEIRVSVPSEWTGGTDNRQEGSRISSLFCICKSIAPNVGRALKVST
jgi:hypothetical protein